MSDRKLIENAPRDGRHILLWYPSGYGWLIGGWDAPDQEWVLESKTQPNCQPTHWAELPPEPATQ